jgi:hypothetical protein
MIRKLAVIFILTLIFTAGCGDEEVEINENINIQEEILIENKEFDRELRELIEEGDYTFNEPYILVDPYDASPLTAVVGFPNNENLELQVTVLGDKDENDFKYYIGNNKSNKEYYISIVGLYAGKENEVKLELIDDGEVVSEKEIIIETKGLPEDLINAVQIEDHNEGSFDGFIFSSGGGFRSPYAFDSQGNIRWYVDVESDAHGIFFMDNGRYMLMSGYDMVNTETRDYSTRIFDMDLLGKLHKIYDIPKGVHHEVVEKTPGGNLIILANSLRNHAEDTVVEVDRYTGEILREIDFNEIIVHEGYNDDYDWAHINSIDYNQEDNTAIFSIRDVSTVLKLDMETEEIIWMMSDPKIWENTEYEKYLLKSLNKKDKWFYEQHSVFEVEDLDDNPETLDIMVFDNRTLRSKTMTVEIEEDKDKSSVIYYAVKEEDGTVEEKRRFSNTHAFITSNYQLLMDEYRLFANHGSVRASQDAGFDEAWGEIYEYEYSSGKLIRTYKMKHGFYRTYVKDLGNLVEEWELE